MFSTSTISNALQFILLRKIAAYQWQPMYTNGNVGNTFDQYKISYILLCIIIIIMQEVNITCPVFVYLIYVSQKGPSVLCGVLLWAWWSFATKIKRQTTTPSATPPPLQLYVHDGVFGVSYTTPYPGKWKWGRTGEGEVEESDIIMTLSEPCAVGKLFQAKAEEKDVVDLLFSSISVDLKTSCKQDRGRANKDDLLSWN